VPVEILRVALVEARARVDARRVVDAAGEDDPVHLEAVEVIEDVPGGARAAQRGDARRRHDLVDDVARVRAKLVSVEKPRPARTFTACLGPKRSLAKTCACSSAMVPPEANVTSPK
jgi:hypothetical protein